MGYFQKKLNFPPIFWIVLFLKLSDLFDGLAALNKQRSLQNSERFSQEADLNESFLNT